MNLHRARILVPAAGRPFVDGDALDHRAPLVWTVPDLLDRAECAAQIARIDALGPTAAPITTARGPVMDPGVRNNERVIIDDPALAALLDARLGDAAPASLAGLVRCGANERLRCYRYRPGQRFAPHHDGAFVRNPDERSLLTLIVYLNDDMTGGHTDFALGVSVAPRTGTALLFQHALLHEGCPVIAGVKYVLRSDAMYRRPPR